MKKFMHKIQNIRRTCLHNPLQLFPVLDRWVNMLVFPVKSFVLLYSDRKPRTCQKLGKSPGVGKCPATGQHNICKCPTPSAAGIDWCITSLYFYISSNYFVLFGRNILHNPRINCLKSWVRLWLFEGKSGANEQLIKMRGDYVLICKGDKSLIPLAY